MTSAEFGGVTRPARFPTTRPAHARRGRRRSVAATTCSRRGARSPSPCRLESRRGGWQSSRTAAGRGDVGGIRRGHETRAFSDDETGARTTRSAALGRSNDVLAARRSLAVAVSAQESRRGGWQSSRTAAGRGDVGGIRRGHETPRFPTTRPAHARRGRRRSVAATTCSRRGARSPSPCRLKRAGAVAGRAAGRPQGAVTSAEFGGVTRPRVFRRRDRRTHDEVGGARSQQRRARGAALARRRRVGSREPARWLAEQQDGRRAR